MQTASARILPTSQASPIFGIGYWEAESQMEGKRVDVVCLFGLVLSGKWRVFLCETGTQNFIYKFSISGNQIVLISIESCIICMCHHHRCSSVCEKYLHVLDRRKVFCHCDFLWLNFRKRILHQNIFQSWHVVAET